MTDSMNEDLGVGVEAQIRIQEALNNALRESSLLHDGDLLTGWVLCFEKMTDDSRALAGRISGPPGMTVWRALGLSTYLNRSDGLDDWSFSIEEDEEEIEE